MPELRPGPGNVMPGLRDRRNSYRGDLISEQKVSQQTGTPFNERIHLQGKHKEQPHFNINVNVNGKRQTPAIFFDE